MGQLPAITKHAATVARVSIATAMALCGYAFPVASLAIPAATMLLERTVRRPTRLLEEALARGEVLDLSDEQAVAFVQMAEVYLRAARQGEYEHNLKLLAAFLTAELKSKACEPGGFLDMARRVEGLSITSLRAVALIGEMMRRREELGQPSASTEVTAALLASEAQVSAPLEVVAAIDALSDLQGRGSLYPGQKVFIGGSAQHFSITRPLHILIDRAHSIARAESCHQASTVDDGC